MRVTQQPAYVLHARAWRETSLLLEVFSRDFGRVGLLARGVRGARARIARSLLEPLQPLRMDWSGRGELPVLSAAEADAPPRSFKGDALLSAMYVNELLVRLTARSDPHPELFARYAALLEELPGSVQLAWTLRRFERDLLAVLGYALQLDAEAGSGVPIEATRDYDWLPEQGALPAGVRSDGVRVRGAALLALHADTMPGAEDMAALRRLMRAEIGAHAGERGLQAWRVLAEPLRQRIPD